MVVGLVCSAMEESDKELFITQSSFHTKSSIESFNLFDDLGDILGKQELIETFLKEQRRVGEFAWLMTTSLRGGKNQGYQSTEKQTQDGRLTHDVNGQWQHED